jgi:NADPH:quinone reductase-like Zn-dependent oxidoreductase
VASSAGSVATTASPDNFDYCASIGATRLIDYHNEDWTTAFANGYLDVVFDTVSAQL